MKKNMRYWVWALVGVSLGIRLIGLGYPHEVVFDEVHFGKFVTAYCCTGERVFDIHPPHAKLIIAGMARIGGYAGGFSFKNIGQGYGDVPIFWLRLAPALAGALIPWLAYVLLRQAGVSTVGSLFGGTVLLFDNALMLQSRLIALDSMLIAATLGALAAFWAADAKKGGVQIWLYALAGGLAGLAAGVKFTGLAALLLLGIAVIYRIGRGKSWAKALAWIQAGVVVLVGAVIVYALGWGLHYSLLANPGSGDAWQVPTGNVVKDTIEMHKIMLSANYNLEATHPYSSHWWSWPVMRRTVFYWQGGEGRLLYLLGNPVVWWGGGVLFTAALLKTLWLIVSKIRQEEIFNFQFSIFKNQRTWVFLLGYVVAFAPFVRIPRALFLYHYLTPLIFSLLFAIAWLDHRLITKGSDRLRREVYGILGMVVIAGFILFSPLTYGFAAPDWHKLLFWFKAWR